MSETPPTVASASIIIQVRLQVTGPTLEHIDHFKRELEGDLIIAAQSRGKRRAKDHNVVVHLVTSV